MDMKDKLIIGRELPEGNCSVTHSISMDSVLSEIAVEIVADIVLKYSLTVDEVEKVMLMVQQSCHRLPLIEGYSSK